MAEATAPPASSARMALPIVRPRTTIRRRLVTVGLLPAVIIVVSAALAFAALQRNFSESAELLRTRLVISHILQIRQAVVDEETAVRGYVITADAAFLEPYRVGGATFTSVIDSLRPLVTVDPAVAEVVAHLEVQHARWRSTVAEPEIAAVRAGDLAAARDLVATADGMAIMDDIRAVTGRVVDDDQATLAARVASRDAAGNLAVAVTVIGSMLAALVLVLLVILQNRRIARDIADVAVAAAGLAEGDLSVRAPVRRDDEVGVLASAFNAMAVQLERSMAVEHAISQELRDKGAALEAVNHELETFSYSVSHDLRAPLRTIDGFSQILIEDHGQALDPEAHRVAGRVRAASQRMAVLIDDILALSRVGRVPIERADVDLSAMARAIVEALRRADPERVVDVHIEPGLHAVADPRLARVVLDNLLSNAWKFTARTAAATIAVERVDATTFCVRDDGAGFDMAYRDKLFIPFQRLHREVDFPGTGIGLATVQRVVRRHGGSVVAVGRPGHGAAVSFSFERPNLAEDVP